MKLVLKFRWLIIALWVAGAAGLFLSAPNMGELVREKGQITVPDGYSSTRAAELLAELSPEGEGGSTVSSVLVLHREDGLTEADRTAAAQGLEQLRAAGDTSGITSVITSLEMPELAEQLESADGTTMLVLVEAETTGRELSEVREALYAPLAGLEVAHYYTGDWLIGEDVIESSEEGLKKTEFITLFFILGILLLVFRSVVAPFIPLLAVGFSYITAQSVVAYLVAYADFPLSNFTQIFMVAVMFGIGTDYCILLISRFKEELAETGDKQAAILATYKTAGRTVLVSGLAVLVGFSAIGFSTFVLYQSAVAVAVGIAVLLLALVTIVPFFLMLLGKALFWPTRGALSHKPSGLWGAVGSFSLRRPVWALLLLVVVIVPFLTAYKGTVSFNSLDEIGNQYDSVKGFEIIEASFGPGETLPSTVVVKAQTPLDTPEGLAALEQITRELAQVEGVRAVRSATRPTGASLEELQVARQVQQLGDGLGEGTAGLTQIGDGLAEASTALGANAPQLAEAVGGAEELIAGTRQLQGGVNELADGLRQLERGLRDGASGAGELSAGLGQAAASARELAGAASALEAGYRELAGGLEGLAGGYAQAADGQSALAGGLDAAASQLQALGAAYPELQGDEQYEALQATLGELAGSAAGIGSALGELNAQLAGVQAGLAGATDGLAQAAAGQAALADGLGELAAGLGELQGGVAAAANGQAQIVGELPALAGGIAGLLTGQEALRDGFAALNGQLGELTSGLEASVDGLTQVSDGLGQARGYLEALATAPNRELSGWFLPEEAIQAADFQTALDAYLSPDRQTAKFDVVFAGNPYALETMAQIDELEAAVARALQGSSYEAVEYAIGGVTSMNNDLNRISAADYDRTVLLMLIGIALILIVLYRSLVIPIYVIISLLVTYYTSLAVAEVIFVRMLGNTGISWAVPFFGFVLLVALGVDYSIFLMDRFKEYRALGAREAILQAMRKMGTVIMSAAVILGGTFAAMLPSGVMSLLQIATIVLCGLFLYALLMLPLFIPVMVRIFGEANWWPFMGSAAGRGQRAGDRVAERGQSAAGQG